MRLRDLLERETDPRPLALVRIVVGLSAIALAVFVERGGLNRLAVDDVFHAQAVSWLPQLSPGLVDVVLVLWIAFAIALTIGLFARVAAVGLAVVAATTMALDLQAFSNHVALMIAMSALLALGNPSAAWSIDARRRPRITSIPYWPTFLIKFQVSTVYGYAALSKINGSFLGAEVLASRWEPGLGGLVDPLHPLLVAIAVSTVLVEGFLAVALWSERYRRIALPLGLALHVVIPLTLGAVLIPFSTLMLGAYVLFPEWRPGSRVVVWDPRSGFAGGFIRVFRRLDWFGVHGVEARASSGSNGRSGAVPDRVDRATDPRRAHERSDGFDSVDEAIRLVGHRERSEGFDAVRMMLQQSPVTFLFAPVLGVRPFAGLGKRAYRSLARRGTHQTEPIRT